MGICDVKEQQGGGAVERGGCKRVYVTMYTFLIRSALRGLRELAVLRRRHLGFDGHQDLLKRRERVPV